MQSPRALLYPFVSEPTSKSSFGRALFLPISLVNQLALTESWDTLPTVVVLCRNSRQVEYSSGSLFVKDSILCLVCAGSTLSMLIDK